MEEKQIVADFVKLFYTAIQMQMEMELQDAVQSQRQKKIMEWQKKIVESFELEGSLKYNMV